MRPTLILMLVTCMGAFAQAQDNKSEVKVKPISESLSNSVHQTNLVKEQLPTVTAIYLLKHSRIKRALAFKIGKKDVKLA